MSLKVKPLTVFICICLFLFLFIIRFPVQNIRGQIFKKLYEATNVHVVAEDLYLSLLGWPGLGVKNVNVTVPIGVKNINLSSESLVMRIGIGQIFPPAPSFSVGLRSLKGGGDLDVWFIQSKNIMTSDWSIRNVTLGSLFQNFGTSSLEGSLVSKGAINSNPENLELTNGHLDFRIENLKTPGDFVQLTDNYGFQIPALKIGSFVAKLQIKDGLVSFEKCEFGTDSSDLKGKITGSIRLARTMLASELDVVVSLTFSETLSKSPEASAFLSFLSGYKTGASGQYGLKWKTKLSVLMSGDMTALPMKAGP